MDVESAVVERDVCSACGKVCDDAAPINNRCGLQLYASGYSVPISLRLVCHTVAVLSHANVLYAVIHADGYLVILSGSDEVRHIVLMRHAEAHLMAYLVSVDPDRCLNMRTLQEERHTLLLPRFGHTHHSTIGDLTHEVLGRRQEERKLHLSCVAIRLHERIVIVAGIIERTCPARVDRHIIAEAVGEQGSRQCHFLGLKARIHPPGAGKRERVLGYDVATA